MSRNQITTNASAATTAQIRFTPERMERTWDMFTLSGKPVYKYGHNGFTLEKQSGNYVRQQCRAYEDDTQQVRRLEKARLAVGEYCEWREGAAVKSFGIIF